ncbi:hypothetical protein ACS33_01845 [Edwardsiella ictaluri]|nr:hypothetical protein ACS33_01845 [Edwardsiella ictaluri]
MLNMTQQRVRFVLSDHTYAAQAGVNTVGKGKVDDAKTAAKIDCRFSPAVGQAIKAGSPPAG